MDTALILLRIAQAGCIAFGLYLLHLLAFVARCAYCWSVTYTKDKVPGPARAPTLFGHFLALGGDKGPWNVAAWANEHGGLFKMQIFSQVMYVLSDPAEIARLSRRTGAGPALTKPREMYAMLEVAVKPAVPSILTSEDNAYWRAVRQGAAPCFSNTNIRKVLPLVLDKTLKVAARAQQAAAAAAADSAKGGGGGVEFDVSDAAKRITSDVMGYLLFGQDLGGTDWRPSKYLDVFYPVLLAQAGLISNPLHLLQLWRPSIRHQRRCLAAHNEIMTEMVQRVMQQPPPDYTIAAHLLSVIDPATGAPLTLDKLKSEISVFMAAGFETTSHAITWCLACLAAHPDVQQAVLQELQQLGLAAAAGGSQAAARDIDASDLGRLPFLQAVIKESLRLCPPAPWGGTRTVADRPQEICGYSLPKGSILMITLLPLSLAVRNYGPDALAFKPERWLTTTTNADADAAAEDGGTGSPTRPDSPAGAGLPARISSSGGGGGSPAPPDPFTFLAGPRDCIGQSLAKLEMNVVLATLLARFRVAPGRRLAQELALAAATGQPPAAGIHALAAARVTLQPGEGKLLLMLEPRC